jgi:hypothetical protein
VYLSVDALTTHGCSVDGADTRNAERERPFIARIQTKIAFLEIGL